MSHMKRLLIIGCGDIARRVIPLLAGRYRICALIRTAARGKALSAQGIMPIHGDLDEFASLARLAGLADIVLHLAPPPNAGILDTRTRHLLAALSRGRLPERFVYISTSGVYGDCGGAVVGETRAIHPQNARAQRRADAERQIRGWAGRNGVQASILRVPGIYAAERLPLERIRAGTPAFVAAEDGYTNHIHADDLAHVIVAALRRGKANRVYHASDDSELRMGDYFDAVADAHGLPRPPRVSRAEAQRVLPESLLSFMNESRRLSNERMKRELKAVLRYPTVAAALQSLAAGAAAR
ncbi:NAD dependent epimerase/dehydratase family protein [mine drainage metagenome]|uniref:NAD dependent epimerase/dehydratase family protein n=1 Tax=mine drainage metagenome TaxID=410659 RepID=A0A1J5T7B6_9ZZZZ